LLALLALLLTADVPVPHAVATRTAQAPKIDGRLDEPAWSTAPVIDGFRQSYPLDGAPPSERTRVRVLYDDDALYVGFDCEQTHAPIRERLTRRDRDSESEWAQVMIDPLAEGKMAFAFMVNVSGVLMDAIATDPFGWNFDWDETWEARTARTLTGWSAEFRIPFRVLRFNAALPVQSWGFQLGRYIAQSQESIFWAYSPRDVANQLARLGRLDNLSGLRQKGALELRPFVTGEVRHLEATDVTTASGYDAAASAGLDLKWHITQDLTLDGAIRPDFAQVEADQVILNLTNYETFLPEKRPLFLEGNEVFAFPLQLFYSRRVGIAPTAPTLRSDMNLNETLVNVPAPATIYGAAKLVGRLGTNWTVGALSAVTGRNEVTVNEVMPGTGAETLSQRLVAPLTTHNVLRLRREWGSSGYVGFIGTGSTTFETNGGYPALAGNLQLCPSGATPSLGSRCFRDSYVGGIDGLWRSPSGDYVATGALIGSLVHAGPTATQLDGTLIGPGAHAPGGAIRIAKEGGKPLLASLTYTGMGRTLDYNDLGFMPRQNLHEVKASIGYRTLDVGRYTNETNSALEVSERRSLSGLDLGQLYELRTSLRLKSFWTVSVAGDLAPPRFDDREVGNGAALERGGYVGGRFEVSTDPKRTVFVDLSGQAQLIQNDAKAYTAAATLTLSPLPQFDVSLLPQVTWSAGEPRYTSTTVTAPMGGAPDYVFGKLTATSVSATLRASYTFTPRLTLQTYAQAFLAAGRFTDLRATPAAAGQRIRIEDLAVAPSTNIAAIGSSPDFEQAALNLNVVFRWEYRLGSTIFLVYSRSQVPDIATFALPATLQPRALGTRASADVILLKLSYWWAS
jgi:hypothetical protein